VIFFRLKFTKPQLPQLV